MDVRSNFWQVAIDQRDADKTAFVTRKRQFRFRVLSFGLANSSSIFQRLMNLVLAGLIWGVCLVHSDVIVMGKGSEDHVCKVAHVLQRLRQAGLKLKPSKCKLFQENVTFLGHVVSRHSVEPEKISSIAAWPEPKCLTEVRSFLGLAIYYKNFVENFGELARPMYKLTRKGARFVWDDRCRQALRRSIFVYVQLLSWPHQRLRNEESTCWIWTRTPMALGRYYSNDGQLRVIGYASRLFSGAQRSYCLPQSFSG